LEWLIIYLFVYFDDLVNLVIGSSTGNGPRGVPTTMTDFEKLVGASSSSSNTNNSNSTMNATNSTGVDDLLGGLEALMKTTEPDRDDPLLAYNGVKKMIFLISKFSPFFFFWVLFSLGCNS